MEDSDRVAREIGRRLRRLRIERGLTLRNLAREAGVSEALLSRIERGQVATTVANLVTLAARLGVGLGEIFTGAESADPPHYALTRAGELDKAPATLANGYEYRALATAPKDSPMSALIVTYTGGTGESWLTHPGYELLYVLSGRLRFRLGEEELLLGPGDSLLFDSRQPHAAESLGRTPARTLMVLARDAAAMAPAIPPLHPVLVPGSRPRPAAPPRRRKGKGGQEA